MVHQDLKPMTEIDVAIESLLQFMDINMQSDVRFVYCQLTRSLINALNASKALSKHYHNEMRIMSVQLSKKCKMIMGLKEKRSMYFIKADKYFKSITQD